MSKELELYQAFIDGLVERKDSMTALWVKGDGFPKTEDNKAKNELLAALTPEQKGVLAEMLQDEHRSGRVQHPRPPYPHHRHARGA